MMGTVKVGAAAFGIAATAWGSTFYSPLNTAADQLANIGQSAGSAAKKPRTEVDYSLQVALIATGQRPRDMSGDSRMAHERKVREAHLAHYAGCVTDFEVTKQVRADCERYTR